MSSTATGNFKGENGTDAHRSFPRDTWGFLKDQTYIAVLTFARILKKIFFIYTNQFIFNISNVPIFYSASLFGKMSRIKNEVVYI